MVKATELRIGNWVECGQFNKPEQVVDIMCDGINTELFQGLTYELVDPIPLTPEWLERVGFTADADGDCTWYEFLSDNGVLFISGDKNKYLDVFLDMNESVRVKYLHQLQNLFFSLCATELVVK